jgi:hypothetical protein
MAETRAVVSAAGCEAECLALGVTTEDGQETSESVGQHNSTDKRLRALAITSSQAVIFGPNPLQTAILGTASNGIGATKRHTNNSV